MPELLTFVLLSLATYRVARFVVLDSLIDGARDRVLMWLNDPQTLSPWRLKAFELLTCPFCITVWIAAAFVVFWSFAVRGEWIGWAFLVVWPATAAGSLVPWAYIDSED